MDRRNSFVLPERVHPSGMAEESFLRLRHDKLSSRFTDIHPVRVEAPRLSRFEETIRSRRFKKVLERNDIDASGSVQSEEKRQQQHADIELRG